MDISSKPIRKLNEKYQNILFLHDELARAGVPHELSRFLDGWIIIYEKDGVRIGDVTTHFFSYGHETDLMEAYGFQECEDGVIGDLGVDEAFELFKNAHER